MQFAPGASDSLEWGGSQARGEPAERTLVDGFRERLREQRDGDSDVDSEPANDGHLKTGQRELIRDVDSTAGQCTLRRHEQRLERNRQFVHYRDLINQETQEPTS